ncbi:MAG: hypothetical protein J6A62_08600 [Oscillospiraceae bacterium]|nr:hypothetical protein [Oscillospiraceae bacterium]
MSVMKKPDSFYYLEKPLEDDITDFIREVEKAYVCGSMSCASFRISCGMALAYVECRYSAGLMLEDEANDLIEWIYEIVTSS